VTEITTAKKIRQ